MGPGPAQSGHAKSSGHPRRRSASLVARSAFGNHRPSSNSSSEAPRSRRVLPPYDDAAAGEEREAALADMAAATDEYADAVIAGTRGVRGDAASASASFDDFVEGVDEEAARRGGEVKVEERVKGEVREKKNGGGAREAAPREASLQRSMTAVFTPSPGPGGREYKPRSALSLARRRMINKYLPYEWQASLRKTAESIPEQSFNYLLSSLVLIFTAVASGIVAYTAFPVLRTLIIHIFQADPPEARVLQELTYETQYLAAISLVTAILLGNTFGFAFDRQRQIIQEISNEVFALELLLQEAFLELPEPHLRWRVIKHVRRYVENEIQARDIDSPFRVEGAIVGLFEALITLKDEGKRIGRMLSAVEMLAQANSRRGALAAALLPPLHWVLLASLCGMLLIAFILFDSDFPNNVAENRMIFTVLSATLVSILQVLQDISAPDDGLYSVRDAMENRLTYVRWQMDNILNDPAIKVSILGGEGSEEEDEGTGSEEEDGADGGGSRSRPDSNGSPAGQRRRTSDRSPSA